MMRYTCPCNLVEDAHDGLLHAQVGGDLLRHGLRLCRHAGLRYRPHMWRAVGGRAGLQPAGEAVEEIVIVKVVAPERGVFDAGLGQGAVEVEHAHKARPLAAPVGDGQDRAAMAHEAREQVVRILPHRLGYDERGIGIELGEDREALLLRGDETVFDRRLVRVGPDELAAEAGHRGGEPFFHGGLGGPADLIGRLAQIAIGHEQDGFRWAGHRAASPVKLSARRKSGAV
jgi:hypothetical protein